MAGRKDCRSRPDRASDGMRDTPRLGLLFRSESVGCIRDIPVHLSILRRMAWHHCIENRTKRSAAIVAPCARSQTDQESAFASQSGFFVKVHVAEPCPRTLREDPRTPSRFRRVHFGQIPNHPTVFNVDDSVIIHHAISRDLDNRYRIAVAPLRSHSTIWTTQPTQR